MTTQSCNGCDAVDYKGKLDEAGRCLACVIHSHLIAKPKITTSGYTNCEACDEPAMGDLCEWCRLGALANNHDPESIASANFDTQLLAVWRASGEAIADREQDESDVTMRTAFDAAVGTARGIRAAALAAAEDVYAAALATAWSHVREPDTRDQDKN